MNIGFIMASLVIVSALTTLATEGVKQILDDLGKNYSANILAGIVAVVLSAAYGVGYVLIAGSTWTVALVVYLIALVFLAWLCAMVGYDKVKQAVSQIISTSTGTEEIEEIAETVVQAVEDVFAGESDEAQTDEVQTNEVQADETETA